MKSNDVSNPNLSQEVEQQFAFFSPVSDLLVSTQDQVISNTIDDLINERIDWEQNEYRQSNERLYTILTRCYEVFKTINGTSSDAVVARKSFMRLVKSRGYEFKSTTHLMIQVIRVVFGIDSPCASKYSTALRIAAEEGISVNNLKDFFYKHGGIEGVRRKKNDEGLPRHIKGKAILYGPSITTIEDQDLLDEFNDVDYVDSVLFLATYDEDEESFDVISVIQNPTTLKAAFTSLSSVVTDSQIAALEADLADEDDDDYEDEIADEDPTSIPSPDDMFKFY